MYKKYHKTYNIIYEIVYFIYIYYNINMERTLYHGSENIIEAPIFGYGNPNNDYGLGFYCCNNKKIAREWASRKYGYGFVNEYKLRDDNLRILDLTKGENDNVLIWIALLINNRTIANDLYNSFPRELDYLKNNYLIDISKYDAIIGYRADDAYFKFPESFVRSEITINSLKTIYKAGDLGKQYVLISQRAFKLLKYVRSYETNIEDKDKYYERKNNADKQYEKYIIDDQYKVGTRLRDLVMDDNEKQ